MKSDPAPAGAIWETALGELQLQLTKATFDTWVKPTQPLSYENGVLVIGVRNAYAQQWLQHRLYGMVQRVVQQIVHRPVEIQFVLRAQEHLHSEAEPQKDEVLVEVIESPLQPFIQLQKYAIWFWQPVLGSLAFSTWIMLRTLDKQNTGRGKKHRLSVDLLAQTLGCHRQSLTGRKPLEELGGVFSALNRERVALIEAIGRDRDIIYWARVLNALPLLAPSQVEKLSALLQERHEGFLKDFSVDAEKWLQLELPTLIRD